MKSDLKLVKLSPEQKEVIKKLKSWKYRPVTLLSASQPEDFDSLDSLVKIMKDSHVTFLLLHSSKVSPHSSTLYLTLPKDLN